MKNTYILLESVDKCSGLGKKIGFYGLVLGKKCEISDIFIDKIAVLSFPEISKTLRTSLVCDIIEDDDILKIITLNTIYVFQKD